jgi:signal transduction histidine kinase
MHVLVRSRVGRRCLGAFLLLLLPMLAAGWFAFRGATEALQTETHAVLRAASDGAEAQLREFLSSLKRTTESLGADPEVSANLEGRSGRPVDMTQLLERVRTRVPEAQAIFWMNPQGHVVSSSGQEFLGKQEAGTPIFDQGRQSFYPGDVVRDPKAGDLQWVMSAPVKDPRTEQVLGVVGLEVDPRVLSALTTGSRDLQEGSDTQSFRMGETGETYLVNRSGFMLTESRFIPNSVLRVKVYTKPVQAAVQRGQEMIGDYLDYRGVPVSGASAILRDCGWVLLTEIDFTQEFVPIRRLRNLCILLCFLVGLAAVLIARRFARGIVDPLRMLDMADRALMRNDVTSGFVSEQRLPPDEIGDAIRKRNSRVRELLQHQEALLAEQRARAEAAAELQRLSYSMVHDMRAPLRAIITLGDLLQAEAGGQLSETQRGYIERMRTSSLRMDRLICDMLKYSSLLQGDVSLSPVNVSELLRRVISESPVFRGRATQIQVDANMPGVIANQPLMTQCFSALLDNAIRYARPGVIPQISVRAEKKPDQVRISVEDNGMGMPREFQKRVFGLFEKGTTRSEGAGIGLALVRVAVERMGGRVGVSSEEAVGSCFWIELKPAE